MKSVCFIPARKGSKGLPGKNKKLFHGKPLIQWSIEQAQKTKVFDRIVVSSDDEEILALGEKLGTDTIMRQEILADDKASLDDVLFDFFSREENECEYICMLQPTSPLRSVDDIKTGFKHIKKKKIDSVIGVTWNPIMGWVEKVAKVGSVPTAFCLYKIDDRPNRQKRDDWYLENGALYWMKLVSLINTGNRVGNPMNVKLHPMPPERSLEVDTHFDWYMAEAAYEYAPV